MPVVPRFFLAVSLVITIGLAAQEEARSEDVLVQALKDEMHRSLTELQIDNEPKPYFIAYTVDEVSNTTVRSVLGATTSNTHRFDRDLFVSVRVGSRELDNSNFVSENTNPFGASGASLPLIDSYDELRRVIWMQTDAAYKSVIGLLSEKKTVLAQQPDLDRADDFNVEEPFEYTTDASVPAVENDKLVAFANEISALMKSYAEIQHAFTIVSFSTVKRTYIDTDGNFHRVGSSLCFLRTHATAQANDGAMVHDYVVAYATDCAEFFASTKEMKVRHESMVASLLEFRSAEQLRAYTGPVLLKDAASASFFAQVFAARAGATPRQIAAPGSFDLLGRLRNPFLDKIGARVLPRFLSVYDDPTVSEFEGTDLFGSFVVDIEGTPSRRTELVRDGKLLTLLTTRSPTLDLNKSTGNNRFGSALPGNIFVTSKETVSEAELKQELLRWAEDSGNEFGIIVKSFQDLETVATTAAFGGISTLMNQVLSGGVALFPTLRAFRVNLDGSEIPLRPMSTATLSDSHFRDIVAVSDTRGAYNMSQTFSPATFYRSWLGIGLLGLGLSPTTSSFMGVVSPAVLLEELELQGGDIGHPRLPIVPPPTNE